ncbi:MAG: FtsX-like permease family protein, partial [Promethearchaeia archaeon]
MNESTFSEENRAYAFSYAVGSMKAYPRRALSLAITLALGFSLVSSAYIWADTGVHYGVRNYFADNSFQMLIETPVGMTQEAVDAESYALDSPLVKDVYRLNSTVGLVSATRLPDSTTYGIDLPIYTDGLKDCQVIFVNNAFLDTLASEMLVEGNFSIGEGEILVSSQFCSYYYDVFDRMLALNSTIDIEVLKKAPAGDSAPIGDLDRTSLESLRVAGIYEMKGYDSLVESAFPSIMRSNYESLHYDTPVLGIRDSILVLAGSIGTESLPESGFFGVRTLVRASCDALIARGATSMADNLLTLKERIDEQFDVDIEGLSEIQYMQSIVDTYLETLPISLLNLPIFLLAFFLSVFAADGFMATRKGEVSALRSKGASSNQIYAIFIAEVALMALLGMLIGLVLAVFLAALIHSATSFMVFDWTLYQTYLANTVVTPQGVLYSIFFCILPPLLFILYSARKAAMAEIGSSLVETDDIPDSVTPAYRFTIGASIFLLGLVAGAIFLLPTNTFVFMLEIGFGTAAWFFMAYNGSRIARVGFSRFTSRISFLLGEKNRITAGNLKVRKGRIVPLMVILTLTLSSTIAFAVQANSYEADLEREVSYAVGADMRVSCSAKPFSFNETIEQYPGVLKSTPFLQTWASVGTHRITLLGTDAIEYASIGAFDESSFFGKAPDYVLSRLHSIENGILLSKYHADRWNKSIGDSLNVQVGGRLKSESISFVLTGLLHTAPGFGYASPEDIPPSGHRPAFGYQPKFSGFAITNLEYLSTQTDISTAELFLCDLVCMSDQDTVLRGLEEIPGVTATTPEKFDLERHSFSTVLFLSTAEGLSSIGFVMSFTISIFALTLFLGSVVHERKRDYAILRAVGASRNQVIKIVFSEFSGVVLASLTLSLILGTIFGYILSILLFSMSPFSRVLGPIIIFPVRFLMTVLLLEVSAMMIGCYFPAKEAAKTDPAIILR